MRRMYAERHPGQRERLGCFEFAVIISSNYKEVVDHVLSVQSDAMSRRRDLSDMRLYIHRKRTVLTKSLSDAVMIGMMADAVPMENPNVLKDKRNDPAAEFLLGGTT